MPKTSAHIVWQAELSTDPATPAAGYSVVYPRSDGKWYSKNSAGTITEITNTAGGNFAKNIIQSATNEIIENNYSVIVSGAYRITGVLSLTIQGNGRLTII